MGASKRANNAIEIQSGCAVVANKKQPKWNCAMIMTTTMIKLDKFTLSTPVFSSWTFAHHFFPFFSSCFVLASHRISESFFLDQLHCLKTNFISQPAVEWISNIFYGTLFLLRCVCVCVPFHFFCAANKFDKFHSSKRALQTNGTRKNSISQQMKQIKKHQTTYIIFCGASKCGVFLCQYLQWDDKST